MTVCRNRMNTIMWMSSDMVYVFVRLEGNVLLTESNYLGRYNNVIKMEVILN